MLEREKNIQRLNIDIIILKYSSNRNYNFFVSSFFLSFHCYTIQHRLHVIYFFALTRGNVLHSDLRTAKTRISLSITAVSTESVRRSLDS